MVLLPLSIAYCCRRIRQRQMRLTDPTTVCAHVFRRWCALDLFGERQLQHRRDGAGLLQRHSSAAEVRGKTRDDRRKFVETARGHQPGHHMDGRVHMLEQR